MLLRKSCLICWFNDDFATAKGDTWEIVVYRKWSSKVLEKKQGKLLNNLCSQHAVYQEYKYDNPLHLMINIQMFKLCILPISHRCLISE